MVTNLVTLTIEEAGVLLVLHAIHAIHTGRPRLQKQN